MGLEKEICLKKTKRQGSLLPGIRADSIDGILGLPDGWPPHDKYNRRIS